MTLQADMDDRLNASNKDETHDTSIGTKSSIRPIYLHKHYSKLMSWFYGYLASGNQICLKSESKAIALEGTFFLESNLLNLRRECHIALKEVHKYLQEKNQAGGQDKFES